MSARGSAPGVAQRLTGRQKLLLAVLVLVVGAMVLFPAQYVGGNVLEVHHADATSLHTSGWVVTQDVSPGDRVAVRVSSMAGRNSWIREIRARVIAGAEHKDIRDVLDTVWKDLEGQAESVVLALEVPREIPLGPARIVLDLDEQVQEQTGRMLNTVYVSSSERRNRLELPFVVRSAAERDANRLRSRVGAAAAWLVVCLAMFALTCWGFRRVRISFFDPSPRIPASVGLVLLLFVTVGAAFSVVGQVVFVRPIAATLVPIPSSFTLLTRVLWLLAIVLGAWAGLLARKPVPRWFPLKIRAVVGSAREHTYRSAGPNLPATLSRDAPRCGAERLIVALRELGLEIDAKRGMLLVSCDGEAVLRIRTRGPEPWLPEDLALQVREGIDPAPIIGELAKLYGPLEYKQAAARAMMVENAQ